MGLENDSLVHEVGDSNDLRNYLQEMKYYQEMKSLSEDVSSLD